MDIFHALLIVIIAILIGFIYYLRLRAKVTLENIPPTLEDYLQASEERVNCTNLDTQKSINNINLNCYKLKTVLNDRLDENVTKMVSVTANNEIILNKTVNAIKGSINNTNGELTEIKNQLNALQQYTIEKDKRIRRFEDGYDYKIQNKFIKEIIDMIDFMSKQNLIEQNPIVNEAIDDLMLLLENNSIHTIDIKVNESFIGQEQIAKVESIEQTEDEKMHNIIKDIYKNGYLLVLDDNNHKIIRPASVIIYKFIKKEEECQIS